ncbi:hypothetical protein VNO80_09724 [Phaseolus coccineus]|uniref:Uncharacterized protein n=1 Tax=Phaseolus coccineus TaxID=3886 RepID=A0AAN9N8K4_PHACN
MLNVILCNYCHPEFSVAYKSVIVVFHVKYTREKRAKELEHFGSETERPSSADTLKQSPVHGRRTSVAADGPQRLVSSDIQLHNHEPREHSSPPSLTHSSFSSITIPSFTSIFVSFLLFLLPLTLLPYSPSIRAIQIPSSTSYFL